MSFSGKTRAVNPRDAELDSGGLRRHARGRDQSCRRAVGSKVTSYAKYTSLFYKSSIARYYSKNIMVIPPDLNSYSEEISNIPFKAFKKGIVVTLKRSLNSCQPSLVV